MIIKVEPPMPPDNLPIEATSEWLNLVRILDVDILKEADESALYIFSTSMALYRSAGAQLETHGAVVNGKMNQWLRVQKECYDRIKGLLIQFGLTPLARAQLAKNTKVEPVPDEDELAGLVD
jgi:P27 family predicted phage terminase small subunit